MPTSNEEELLPNAHPYATKPIFKSIDKENRMRLSNRFFMLAVLLVALIGILPVSAQDDSLFGDVIAEYETIQGDPEEITSWVVWDGENCSWVDVTEDAGALREARGLSPDSYTAILREAGDSDFIIAWTPQDQVFDTLVVANASFATAAETSGMDVRLFDNAYPSVEAPISAAEQTIQVGSDVVISMLVLADLHPAILEMYAEACIPVIGHSVPHEGQPFFGGSFLDAGKLAAEYLGAVATEHGWTPEDTTILLCQDDRFVRNPGSPYDGIVGFREVIAESFPGMAEEKIVEINCPSDIVTDEINVTDWLTANPTEDNLIMFGLNDLRALGMYNAVNAAGIQDRAILAGVGVSIEAQDPICNDDTTYLMSVDFVPQLWGEYGVALAQDVLEGIPIPSRVLPVVQPVDASNIRDLGMDLCGEGE